MVEDEKTYPIIQPDDKREYKKDITNDFTNKKPINYDINIIKKGGKRKSRRSRNSRRKSRRHNKK